MSKSAETWFSVHLDLADASSEVADQVIHQAVPALIEWSRSRGLAGHFFIRYRDPAPHIRLRLLLPTDRHPEPGEVLARIKVMPAVRTLVVNERIRPYEPETLRYGGAAGVALSERLFEVSSDLVLGMTGGLIAAGSASETRFAYGTLGIALLVANLLPEASPEGCSSFLRRYEEGTLRLRIDDAHRTAFQARYVDLAQQQGRLLDSIAEVLGAVDTPDRLPEPLGSASVGFRQIQVALVEAFHEGRLRPTGQRDRTPSQTIERLTASYVHMHLNRLGVAPIEELLACRIAGLAFDRSVQCA